MSKGLNPVVDNKAQEPEAKAILRNLRVSVQKVNLVLSLIRKMPVEKALNFLTACKKRVSNDVKDLLLSAIANGENNLDMDVDSLVVEEAYAGRAFGLKRSRPRAKGRSSRIIKHGSHVTIVLKEEESA